jgi:predicted metal-dependent hydrolase
MAPDPETMTTAPRAGPTPPDHAITVRDSRFGRGRTMGRWWCNGDPVATAWMNALSATFPKGETLFVDSVKAFREGAPPRLEREIRAFVRQEVNHTREHLAFNRAAAGSGYDMRRIDQRIDTMIAIARGRPPIVQLAVTMALEHFTAMFAHVFLAHPLDFFAAEVEQSDIWRWHAIEEIEHKGVAFDTWLHATRDWSRWRRWRVKALVMLLVTRNFVRNRTLDALDLLAQDGITGRRAKRRFFWYLFGRPGVLRRIFPAWLSYFLPGFHPWKRDDRALIARYDSEFADAAMAAE